MPNHHETVENAADTPLGLSTIRDITAELRRRGLPYVLVTTDAKTGQVYEHTNLNADIKRHLYEIALDDA